MLALTGSEKQIQWAEKLRADARKKLDVIATKITGLRDENPELADQYLTEIKEIFENTDSKTWIDNRDCIYDGPWLAKRVAAKHVS